MDDEAFLGYVDIHSRTERHLFSKEDVQRLLELACAEGARCESSSVPGFVGLDEWTAVPLVRAARARMRSPCP
jgi:hypothetical protein